MGLIITLVVSMVAVGITAYLLPGVTLNGAAAAFWVVIALGLINAIVKPILLILTLPINLLTLGLFTFVINALVVLLASSFVPGFTVDGFLPALLFSIVLSIVSAGLGMMIND